MANDKEHPTEAWKPPLDPSHGALGTPEAVHAYAHLEEPFAARLAASTEACKAKDSGAPS